LINRSSNRRRLWFGLPCQVVLLGIIATLNACSKGKKTAEQARLGSEFKAETTELQNPYPPNFKLSKNLYYTVKSKSGQPISGVQAEFKAFLITDAVKAGLSDEIIKEKILDGWNGGDFVMQADGSISGTSCMAGAYRENCVGILVGGSSVSNQFGQAHVGFTTPNMPAAKIAVAMRVPPGSLASDLIQFYRIDITTNEEFITSGIDPLDSAITKMADKSSKLELRLVLS
jgi:hypothetical protein